MDRLPYGSRILATDIRKFNHKPSPIILEAPQSNSKDDVEVIYCFSDALRKDQLEKLIVDHDVDMLIHFSAILSAIGEKDPERALQLNVSSVHNALQLAEQHNLRLFIPSTIGAFGPLTPRLNTPDVTIMRPTTIYGISKLHMELLGEWYSEKHGVDFRSLRLPGILSFDSAPGGGTTDYAIHMMLAAAASRKEALHGSKRMDGSNFSCFLKEDSRLPMMHIQDTLQGMIDFLFAPNSALTQRVYNIHAMDFTPKELEIALQLEFPSFPPVLYEPDCLRQKIADSWPISLDDAAARRDWQWNPRQLSITAMLRNFNRSLA